MKNLLVCASCPAELSEFQLVRGRELATGKLLELDGGVHVLVSGVGSWLSAFNLTKVLTLNAYSLVLFVGICGEYDMGRELRRMVHVDRAAFADCGFDRGGGVFESIVGSKFLPKDSFPFSDGWLVNNLAVSPTKEKATSMVASLPRASANTVQRCCYDRDHVDGLLARMPADVETMESAAFHFVCQQLGQKYAEVRCTSNYVDARSPWHAADCFAAIGGFLNRIVPCPGS